MQSIYLTTRIAAPAMRVFLLSLSVDLFKTEGEFTVLADELTFRSPLGFLGEAVDHLVLRAYLTGFLEERNRLIREVAESDHWPAIHPR